MTVTTVGVAFAFSGFFLVVPAAVVASILAEEQRFGRL